MPGTCRIREFEKFEKKIRKEKSKMVIKIISVSLYNIFYHKHTNH